LALFAAVAWLLVRHLPMNESLATLAGSLLGLLYIPYLLHFFYAIYFAPNGLTYSLLLFALVWGYDTGAYLTGSLWGRHRVYPIFSPSPQKSWEGIAGGLFLTLAMVFVSRLWIAWPDPMTRFLIQAGPLVLLTGLTAQLGDFFESKLKRAAGAKDAGKLFPGHGGLLDRIDGLLFVLPLFYGYLRYILHWL
jgi:phosphatidate cytidylyltransferase